MSAERAWWLVMAVAVLLAVLAGYVPALLLAVIS